MVYYNHPAVCAAHAARVGCEAFCMIAKLIIERKRDGEEIPAGELREFVAAYTRGEVPDYQMSAFAMAVLLKGMTGAETAALTDAMEHSGETVDWSDCPLPTADKHSTGGVGDKLSLVIQPLAAACGLAVPSLTGRGLGHTGGTADKLESIPGYNASLSLADFKKVVMDVGVSMTVQTAEIAPADRKLYALRDVTGTVPSIPLITASILSKKLAEGAGTLVFDVKCGRGAFMKTRAAADDLAEHLVSGAKAAGRKAAAIVTAMDEPIGRTVGNALEVKEALDVLSGDPASPNDVTELSVEFAAKMVELAKGVPAEEALALCSARLADGSALRRFEAMVAAQGGDLAAFRALDFEGALACEVRAEKSGKVASVDALAVAEAALMLGAGRAAVGDAIDPMAGVVLVKRSGDEVKKGDVLCRLYGKREKCGEEIVRRAASAYQVAGL